MREGRHPGGCLVSTDTSGTHSWQAGLQLALLSVALSWRGQFFGGKGEESIRKGL